MKKVQPSLTLGHITFLLLAFFIASGIFFYLGAKLGPGVIVFDSKAGDDQSLLPDEAVAEEARRILIQAGHTYVFHDVLQGKSSLEADLPKVDTQVKAASFFTKDNLLNLDNDLTKKDAKEVMGEIEKPIAKKIEAPLKDKNTITAKEPVSVKPSLQSKPIALVDLVPESVPVEPKSSAAYRLQIGSYSDKAKAEKALLEWRSRGFSAQVITTEVPGKGIWYRLNLGSYDDASAAQKAQSEISAKFRQTPMVVSNR